MFKLNASSVALIIGNLVPIIGVLFFSWQLFPIILLYWLENVIIGVFNVLKMLTCADKKSFAAKLFMTAFFSVHYGLFCMVHGTFVVELFGSDDDELIHVIPIVLASGIKWALLALMLSHAFSLFSNYFLAREYQRLSTSDIMFLPYRRIIVLHVFIIFGAMALSAFGVSQLGLVALAAIKIAADWLAHNIEHRRA